MVDWHNSTLQSICYPLTENEIIIIIISSSSSGHLKY